MKLMQWDEFRRQPAGTFYQDYQPNILGELMMFGEDLGSDFTTAPALPHAILGANLPEGHPYREAEFLVVTPTGFGNDGMYGLEKRWWLVWERVDRERLALWLHDPPWGASKQNDDDMLLLVPEEITKAPLSRC